MRAQTLDHRCREMQPRGRRGDRAFFARKHCLIVAAVALVDVASARDIGRQRHVAALGERLVEHCAMEREGKRHLAALLAFALRLRPRHRAGRGSRHGPRRRTARCRLTASRFAGLTKARQREPSSRLISVAEMAGSCSPRPMRRPWRLAGNTLVSLTTTASPGRNRLGRFAHGAVLEARRRDAPPEASRHRAARPAAARCGPPAARNRTGRCASKPGFPLA